MPETIDLTNEFDSAAYMEGASWALDRGEFPVRAIPVHHTAGFYGRELGPDASEAEEGAQLFSMAADHHSRFGIGPGYNYVAFPSGRLYAVGKAGTHRAHTKGRNPETGERWNVDGIAVCAMGNYEQGEPTQALLQAIRQAVTEIRGFSFARVAPAYPHGRIPTVNSAGVAFSQATDCPGRNLAPFVAGLNGDVTPEPELDAELLRGLMDDARTSLWEADQKLQSIQGELERTA